MSEKIYTAIDANINRAQEGVRVCEDIMRFYYSSGFASDLKNIRHSIRQAASLFQAEKLIGSRDVSGDDQKFNDTLSEKQRESLPDIFMANLHRATEALRCLEEFSKYTGEAQSDNFQSIRFSLYDLESRAAEFMDKTGLLAKLISGIYCILDVSDMGDEEAVETAAGLIDAEPSCIQLDLNGMSGRNALSVSEKIRLMCSERGILFIVNRLDVFIACSADALVLKQNDIPLHRIDKIIPAGSLTGMDISEVNNPKEINGMVNFLVMNLSSESDQGTIAALINQNRPCFVTGCHESGFPDKGKNVFPAVKIDAPGRESAEQKCIKCIKGLAGHNYF